MRSLGVRVDGREFSPISRQAIDQIGKRKLGEWGEGASLEAVLCPKKRRVATRRARAILHTVVPRLPAPQAKLPTSALFATNAAGVEPFVTPRVPEQEETALARTLKRKTQLRPEPARGLERAVDPRVRAWYNEWNASAQSGLVGMVPECFRKGYARNGISLKQVLARPETQLVLHFLDFLDKQEK